jgi:hypothetical protein
MQELAAIGVELGRPRQALPIRDGEARFPLLGESCLGQEDRKLHLAELQHGRARRRHQARARCQPAGKPASVDGNPFETLSLSGTGETLEEALVSCIGEGIERLAQFERSGDVRARASLPELRDRVMPSLVPLIERQLANTPAGDVALEWIVVRALEFRLTTDKPQPGGPR